MRRLAVLLAVVTACGPMEPADDAARDLDAIDGATDASGDATDATRDALDASADASTDVAMDATTYEREYVFTMANQAFPDSGHPGALVHIPPAFDAAQPFGVVIFVHGFKNCITNCVGDTDTSCTPGAAPRASYNLIAQFDAAHLQALLVLPEVAFDQSTGNPGQLGTAMGLYRFLDELFMTDMAPVIGPHHVEDLGRIAMQSHSGGYWLTAIAATMGGVPQVREIDLLDSLYGETMLFDMFVMMHVAHPAAMPGALGAWRFASVYTDSGGTAMNNMLMAMRAMGWVSDPSLMLGDNTYGTLMPADYEHPLIFKRSSLAHDGVPRYYFGEFLAASGFARTE